MHIDTIDEKLKSIRNDAQHMIVKNIELQEENKKLEGSLRKQRHLKDEYKQMAEEAIAQVQDLREPKDGAADENENLKELSKAQQQKLNDIYEASAKAHYEAELWQKRYEAAEQYIKDRLEITPASIPYDNVRMVLNAIKKHDLHELD